MTDSRDLLSKLYTNLKNFAHEHNHHLVEIEGANGYLHAFGEGIYEENGRYKVKRPYIAIGKDQSLLDQVITLAHELGHLLDYRRNPMSLDEVKLFLQPQKTWQKTEECLIREENAWAHAHELLRIFDGYDLVEDRLLALEEESLESYRRLVWASYG